MNASMITGSGSLKAALTASGPRTVIFTVGGTIDLAGGEIWVRNGDVTIAGETAPGDGILIRGGRVVFQCSNVVMRHIRIRQETGTEHDCLDVYTGDSTNSENIIFDHISLSWGNDENLDFWASGPPTGVIRSITLQNSILAESDKAVLQSYNTYDISYINNLFAHHATRHPYVGWPYQGADQHFEQVNNLLYGVTKYATDVNYGAKFSVVNNIYKSSVDQPFANDHYVIDGAAHESYNTAEGEMYETGNVFPNEHPSNLQIRPNWENYRVSSDFSTSEYDPESTATLETSLLSHVGASLPSRDAVDTRLIHQYNTGTGYQVNSGTFPTLANGNSPTDSDNDGMSDAWEEEYGFNVGVADHNGDHDNDGYTNIEEYLHYLAGEAHT